MSKHAELIERLRAWSEDRVKAIPNAVAPVFAKEWAEQAATLSQAATAIAALVVERDALQKERDYAVKWANTSLDSVKAVMWHYEDALKSVEAWLTRWGSHVAHCRGYPNCTCGLDAMRHEARAALAQGGET